GAGRAPAVNAPGPGAPPVATNPGDPRPPPPGDPALPAAGARRRRRRRPAALPALGDVPPLAARLRRLLPRPRQPGRRLPHPLRRAAAHLGRAHGRRDGVPPTHEVRAPGRVPHPAPRARDADALRLGRRRPDLPRAPRARDGAAVPERRRLPPGAEGEALLLRGAPRRGREHHRRVRGAGPGVGGGAPTARITAGPVRRATAVSSATRDPRCWPRRCGSAASRPPP